MNRVALIFLGVLLLIMIVGGGIVLLSSGNDNDVDVPDWVVYPGDAWQTLTAEQSGLDTAAFRSWVEAQQPQFGKGYGGQQPSAGGAVLTRGGFIVATWGDIEFRHQSASLGKTFTRMALQLAIDDGLIQSADERVATLWSGAGELEEHKRLDRGFHRTLTFKHLVDMRGGFPVTNGFFWRDKHDVPEWSDHSGDPTHDNYAHCKPGKNEAYSSGGYWRLSQALTAVWQQDLKHVLDERIMRRIGIPAQRWEWLAGEEVRNKQDFYPEMPGYGDFLDAPFDLNGIVVRGGPGWVVMSAEDLARIGLLIATGGVWEGERLISAIGGNSGVQANSVEGWGVVRGEKAFISFGRVATGFDVPTPDTIAKWINGPVAQRTPVTSRRDEGAR